MNERCLTLYTRRGCPLCDEMAADLAAWLASPGIRLETVDVDTSQELKAWFDWDVPLLFEGEVEICRHEFDAMAFEKWLREV